MIRYVFKDGPVAVKGMKDANPQAIGEALAAIAAGAGGELTPGAVVETARDPENVLHPHFDWDDAAAAERWRVEQARSLIRCIRVEDIAANDEPVRAFLSVTADDGVAYRSVEEIRSSSDLQQRLLGAAERDLHAFTVRYRVLKDICAIVETARKAAKAKRTKDESRAAA